jgi:ubiquinone/menaquinone biosynthesis C-methylase UbiE
MAEIDLLRALPKGKRNVIARGTAKTDEHIRISRKYGAEYFDGAREYGYGGYRYDGRWQPVAADIVEHFQLKPGDGVLDVGCAKGFLVKDLLARLHLGSADDLPFPDGSFTAVLSINTVHNLTRDRAKVALKEMQRLAPGKGFVQVDSYRTPQQKEIFESWVLTAKFHDYPNGWESLFDEAGYKGDWYWTIIQ